MSSGRWNIVQEFCFGRINLDSNKVRNSTSVLQCHSALRPKDRDGMSDMAFCGPGICIGTNGEAFAIFSRIDSTRSNAAAVFDFFDDIFVSQEIVGVLSFNRATCFECSNLCLGNDPSGACA